MLHVFFLFFSSIYTELEVAKKVKAGSLRKNYFFKALKKVPMMLEGGYSGETYFADSLTKSKE